MSKYNKENIYEGVLVEYSSGIRKVIDENYDLLYDENYDGFFGFNDTFNLFLDRDCVLSLKKKEMSPEQRNNIEKQILANKLLFEEKEANKDGRYIVENSIRIKEFNSKRGRRK